MTASLELPIWQVGSITIAQLVEVDADSDVSEFLMAMPGASVEALTPLTWLVDGAWLRPNGQYPWRVQSFLIETAGRRIIVDTCIGNDKDRALEVYRLRTDFLERLEAWGWTPESVDAVVCTHLHVDHVGWNTQLIDGKWVPTFANAQYFFVEEELRHWQAFNADPEAEAAYGSEEISDEVDGKAVYRDSVAPVVEAGLVTLVRPDAQIAPGVRLSPSPGHTPGHACVVIESDGQIAEITGDSLHTPFQIAFPEWSIYLDTDLEAAAASRQSVVDRWGQQSTLIFGTHFGGSPAARVVSCGDRWGLSPIPPALTRSALERVVD